ncbi:NADH dehydrogenase [Cyclobacterium xiamenense]|jgi:NADH dehydrogenase|uniref:NADH:ubiquinone reductase (non-electrogenic) n=1 Tax=Cyclobacterium xiamenense TaxID=1297121 RepID=A0A1H6VH57_9BACT|nr:NAD(P)/FAD-dependent oxidoreductase [Cyclobacterium xiamenense]SEJ03036.1 NADH dehydrogenase [Cyclobacterium xiamenense]
MEQMLSNLPQSPHPRIVIVGAGFAGLKLARTLRNKAYHVILLDKNNYHQFQPLFYQVATAGLEPSAISFPLRKVFHDTPNVTFRMGGAKRIDQRQNRLYTEIGYIDYDYLVLAMGADTNYFGMENIMKNSIPMKSVSEALFIRNKIISNYERAITIADESKRKALMNVVIVGGGPTGVELAGAMAELRNKVFPKDYPQLNFKNMKVVLVEAGASLLAGMSAESGEKAKTYLEKLQVEVLLHTAVADYDGLNVTINGETRFQTHTLLWAAGIVPNHIEGIREEQIAKGGRLLVDAYNRLHSSENIFVLGDGCLQQMEDYPRGHPQVAQVAIQQARNLGANLLAKLHQQPEKPFRYKDLGSMATVGRKLAVVDLPFIKFQGLLAWLTWLFVHLMAIVGVKNRIFIFLDWSWNYLSFDPSLRLLIKPTISKPEDREKLTLKKN